MRFSLALLLLSGCAVDELGRVQFKPGDAGPYRPGDFDRLIRWPEVCDGLDNDLDGEVDEELGGLPCYSEPWGTYAHGPCRVGTEQCVNGAVECVGHIGPEDERCNGIDDDCDGAVDEGSALECADVLVLLDRSQSMCDELIQAECGLDELAAAAAGVDVRLGAVDITTGGAPSVMVPLGGSVPPLGLVGCDGDSRERSLDGISMAVDGLFGWRPDCRSIVILVTDERPQSWTGLSATVVRASLLASRVLLEVWSGHDGWDGIGQTNRPLGEVCESSAVWIADLLERACGGSP